MELRSKRAILHVDGDGFFAACETIKDPSLKGKPVVVGKDRGIAIALTYEAKRLGIQRGMRTSEIAARFPDAIIMPHDFYFYGMIARRMYACIDSFALRTEAYSIDECFADLGPVVHTLNEYARRLHTIKTTLESEIGITFSVGLARTKVLAKFASTYNKPNSCAILETPEIPSYLGRVPVEFLWGIGRAQSLRMHARGIHTALDFFALARTTVAALFAKPYVALWDELHEETTIALGGDAPQQSVMRGRMFVQKTNNCNTIHIAISQHVEIATMRLREARLLARHATLFLKDATLRTQKIERALPCPAASPELITPILLDAFTEAYRGQLLHACSIVLSGTTPSTVVQDDLFGSTRIQEKFRLLHETIHTQALAVTLGSSLSEKQQGQERSLAIGTIS